MSKELDLAVSAANEAVRFADSQIIEARDRNRIALLGLITPGAHTLFHGIPGVAKSMAFDILAKLAPDQKWAKTAAFKGSPPEQFLGPLSLTKLAQDEYVREVTSKFGWAEYYFCDEVYRAPRAVLPVFQTGMSDGVMDNGHGLEPIPLRTMYGATNSVPEPGDDDLSAFHDRWTFKLKVEPVHAQASRLEIMRGYLERRKLNGVAVAVPAPLSSDQIDALIAASRTMEFDQDTLTKVAQLQSNLIGDGIVPSTRRVNNGLAAMQSDALLRGQTQVNDDSIQILRHVLWTDTDEIEQVGARVLEFASEFEKDSAKLADQFDPMKASLIELQAQVAQTGRDNITSEMNDAALKLLRSHQKLRPEVEKLIAQAGGRDTTRLDDIIADMDAARPWVAENILGGVPI